MLKILKGFQCGNSGSMLNKRTGLRALDRIHRFQMEGIGDLINPSCIVSHR